MSVVSIRTEDYVDSVYHHIHTVPGFQLRLTGVVELETVLVHTSAQQASWELWTLINNEHTMYNV